MFTPQRSSGFFLHSALLACAALGCGGQAPSSCPTFSSGVQQPIAVETSVTQLTSGESIDALLVDDTGLYWYDSSGALLSLPSGSSRVVELRPALAEVAGTAPSSAEELLSINGLTSDAESLYWGEGFRYIGLDAGSIRGYQAPGRLLSMPKRGGPETVLLEFSDRTIAPLAVDGTRIVVRVDGVADAGLFQMSKADHGLAPLPSAPPAQTSRVIGHTLYWTDPDEANPRLFRAGFDDVEPELVTRIEGEFDVGPGYVLWRQERLMTEPLLVLDQNFVLRRDDTGCSQPLPGLGETLSYSTALDAQHVYWYSFNGLGSVTAATPSSSETGSDVPPSYELANMPLIRANVLTGVLERLNAPGFSLETGSQILGQDDERLYITTPSGLVAVHKP